MTNEEVKAKFMLLLTHDLTCAYSELVCAARRYEKLSSYYPMGELATAAIAFTIQAAIETGHDPIAMRALERHLFATMIGKPGTHT